MIEPEFHEDNDARPAWAQGPIDLKPRLVDPVPLSPAENLALEIKTLQKDRQSMRGYQFVTFDEMDVESPAKQWLIKGILARGETSAWIAPPGAMKSALLAQAAICVGAGLDWHGYRNKGAAGVVYFAIERADLVKRRLRAHRRILGLAGTPIAVSSSTIDLTHPEAFKKVVDTIRDAKTRRARNGRTITLPEHAGKLLPRSKGSRQKTTNCAAPIVTTPASLEFKTGGLQRWSADLPKLNASLRA